MSDTKWYEISADKFDKFLYEHARKCHQCGAGYYLAIAYEKPVANFGPELTGLSQLVEAKPTSVIKLASIHRLVMGDNEGNMPDEANAAMPDIYTLPAFCDNCGNIQHFSMGHVRAIIEGYSDE